MIFISHSSKDEDLINELNAFLVSIGVPINDIFCSSIGGQGVRNGERISDIVRKKMQDSRIIIYVITNNFLNSTYCTQELGAGWFAFEEKQIFIFKSDEVNNTQLSGFVDTSYKYSLFNLDGLSELCELVKKSFNINNNIPSINNSIQQFLKNIEDNLSLLIKNKNKTDLEINQGKIDNLRKQYRYLSIGEKKVIAYLYFKPDRIIFLTYGDGMSGLLMSKSFIYLLSNQATSYLELPYSLQSWVIEYIESDNQVFEELKGLNEKCGKKKK